MLNFYNTSVLLDTEIDPETDLVWSDNKEEFDQRKNHFYKTNLNLLPDPIGDIRKFPQVSLSGNEFKGFIRLWWKRANFHIIHSTHTSQYWISQYFNTYIDLLSAGKVFKNEISPFDRFSYYDELSIGGTKKLLNDSKEYNTSIDVPKTARPELSWAVEDFLWCLLNKRRCPYTELIMSEVERNIRELQFYSQKFSCIQPTLLNISIKLTNMTNPAKIITVKELSGELLKEDAIYYFQSPFMFHKFSTNFRYIQECLKIYRSEYAKIHDNIRNDA